MSCSQHLNADVRYIYAHGGGGGFGGRGFLSDVFIESATMRWLSNDADASSLAFSALDIFS